MDQIADVSVNIIVNFFWGGTYTSADSTGAKGICSLEEWMGLGLSFSEDCVTR